MILSKVDLRSIINQCIFCYQTTDHPSGTCLSCQDDLPWLLNSCSICAFPLNSNNQLICGQCLKLRPSFTKVDALFLYQFPIDQLVTKIKYNQKTQFIGHLAQLLTLKLSLASSIDCLIPIPMLQRNLLQRGFNQAELLAIELSKLTNLPIDNTSLRKRRPTSKQMGLSRKARLKNQLEAFCCNAIPDKHIVLIDDVMTTGATLEAASRALLSAGAYQVDAIVIARTPK